MATTTPEPDQGLDCEAPIIVYPPMVADMLVRLLRVYFSDHENITSPYVAGLIQKHGGWRAPAENERGGPAQQGIVVEDSTVFKPKLVEARPGIFVRDLGYQYTAIGIRDQYEESLETGATSHEALWPGNVAVMCVAQLGNEVRHLGWTVASYLTEIATLFTTQSTLNHFRVGQAGEPRPLKESENHFAVPVAVNYTADHQWTLNPELPRLKRIVAENYGST